METKSSCVQYINFGFENDEYFISNKEVMHQIVNIPGKVGHWILLTNYNIAYGNDDFNRENNFFYFDSLNDPETFLPELKYFFDHVNPAVTTHQIISCQVQTQKGASACGLFALAFLTAMVYNIDPSTLEFDQDRMASHYNNVIKGDADVNYFDLNFMFPFKEIKRDNVYKKIVIN